MQLINHSRATYLGINGGGVTKLCLPIFNADFLYNKTAIQNNFLANKLYKMSIFLMHNLTNNGALLLQIYDNICDRRTNCTVIMKSGHMHIRK